ncbi:sigma-70 family RNA polymerase sigma factor [Patescibacteria group bacterium]|nr:sigma-70 family RNA polymerase sigma factor [Patescibacteria group bacterium]MBU1906577.1 sigma-70 family RNA polymerase sigma factor [Patescibacteria group bacterium]
MNQRKFEQFYRTNIDRIYRFVFFRVQSQEVAEDLTSEIFMKALKAFDRYDEEKSKAAWIYTIARNHIANYYRDKKDAIDIEEVAFSLMGEDGREEMEKSSDRMLLAKALDELSLEERRLVTLKHLEGYSYKEMAEILDKSDAALKVATHRAMKKLKVSFQSQFIGVSTPE